MDKIGKLKNFLWTFWFLMQRRH